MKNKGFLIALLEDFSLDKIDIVSKNDNFMEGVKPAFGSPGGKFFVAGKLIRLFPEHKRYVESFIGGGSILFRKKRSEEEFINDRDSDIASCFKFMKDITEQQVESLNKLDWKTSKDTFNKLLPEWKESSQHNDPVYQFYRYVYIKGASDAGQMSSFDNRSEGDVMKVTTRMLKIKERLQDVTIENMDYRDFIKKYANKESFTFMDPPYPSAKMDWKWCPTQNEFESFTKTVPGKWMVTYEVCDGWKESKYDRKILSQYNIAAPSAGHMARKSELMVSNYPIKENSTYLESEIDDDIKESIVDFVDNLRLSEVRGLGLGVGGPRQGDAGTDVCVCPKCKEEIKHNRGTPCNESKCPKCGTPMIGKVDNKESLVDDLKDILKLYAAKRRGDDVDKTFEQLKSSFRGCVSDIIESGITDFHPEKLSPFALELFDKYTEYKYTVVQPDKSEQSFKTLKELKDSNVDYRGYKFNIKMKEAEKKIGNFTFYNQWWRNKNDKIDNFTVSTDLGIDIHLSENKSLIEDEFKESTFYIKPSEYSVRKLSEGISFMLPHSDFNITDMLSWIKVIDRGNISILESTELEKIIEFSGKKIKGIFTAKRENENSDFWVLKK